MENGFENVVTTKIVQDKDGKVTGGVDYQAGVAVDKKTDEKTTGLGQSFQQPEQLRNLAR